VRFGADRRPVELALDAKRYGDMSLKGAAPHGYRADKGNFVPEIDDPLNVVNWSHLVRRTRLTPLSNISKSLRTVLASGSLGASVAGRSEVLQICPYPYGGWPPVISPFLKRWSFPRIMRSMIFARSNSETTPRMPSVTLYAYRDHAPRSLQRKIDTSALSTTTRKLEGTLNLGIIF
jgi:hypothetical protein